MDSAFSGIRGIWVLVLFVTLDPSLWGGEEPGKKAEEAKPKVSYTSGKEKNLSPAPQPFFCEGNRRKEDGKESPNTKVFPLPQSLSLFSKKKRKRNHKEKSLLLWIGGGRGRRRNCLPPPVSSLPPPSEKTHLKSFSHHCQWSIKGDQVGKLSTIAFCHGRARKKMKW